MKQHSQHLLQLQTVKTEANKSAVKCWQIKEAKPVVNQSDAKPGELVDVSEGSPIDVRRTPKVIKRFMKKLQQLKSTKTVT